jgi:hypothetical protein
MHISLLVCGLIIAAVYGALGAYYLVDDYRMNRADKNQRNLLPRVDSNHQPFG